MIAISLTFLAGRYHATPWGRHVNEAAPEWPPSPWRLLRSLVATWKRKLPELAHSEVEPILKVLSSPPHFALPPANIGHTRHYMPWLKKGPDDRVLVFDTFVVVPRSSEIVTFWPDVALDQKHRECLARLVEHLGFLGRAEAWCDARLLTPERAAGIDANCHPLNQNGGSENDELVRTLCVDPETAFNDDFVVKVETHVTGRGRNKVSESMRTRLYDPNWNLCMETLQLHKEKWSDPPGSRWISYVRPRNCFEISHKRSVMVKQGSTQPVQVARFTLDSTVLPLVTETLSIAELARRALMGIHGRMNAQPDGSKGRSPTFSGKTVDGNKRATPHVHAFYLPTENAEGLIDQLTIVAEEGFGPGELKALDQLRNLSSHAHDTAYHPLRTLLVELTSLECAHIPLLSESDVWISATPFIAPRHPKRNGRGRDDSRFWRERSVAELETLRREGKRGNKHIFVDPHGWLELVLREELQRLLARRPDLADIDLDHIAIRSLHESGVYRLGARRSRPIQFKRFRQKRGDDGGQRPAGAFEIVFPRKVRGPICLGHSSHFGLGLFIPATNV